MTEAELETPPAEDPRPWEELQRLAEEPTSGELRAFLDGLPEGDVPRVLSRLGEDEQRQILTALPPDEVAGLLDRCADAQAAELIEILPAETAAAVLEELPSDQRADLISALQTRDADEILAVLQPETAEESRELAKYANDTAGGLMATEYHAYAADERVGDVIVDLRRKADDYEDYEIQYLYVVAGEGKLVGVVPIRTLLFAPSEKRLDAIMIRDPLAVRADQRLDELEDFFDEHEFLGAPVVEATGRLVGILHRRAVREAIGERAESDLLKSQGIVGGEEFRSMRLRTRASWRLSWLSVNVVLNVVAASVIAAYQDVLASAIALAVFLPIISDMSGCCGNQAVAVSMRELSLGLIKPWEILYVWGKELAVGVVNGIALGILIAVVAYLWKGNAWLGLVAGGAMALNTLVAVSIGGVVPLVLKRLRLDPALASGPILTTITDVCGFFFVLSFASAVLPRLT